MIIPSNKLLQQFNHLYIQIVKKIESDGKIRISIPQLFNDQEVKESDLPIQIPYLNLFNYKGMINIPDINSMVFVEFVDNNPNNIIYLPFTLNKKDLLTDKEEKQFQSILKTDVYKKHYENYLILKSYYNSLVFNDNVKEHKSSQILQSNNSVLLISDDFDYNGIKIKNGFYFENKKGKIKMYIDESSDGLVIIKNGKRIHRPNKTINEDYETHTTNINNKNINTTSENETNISSENKTIISSKNETNISSENKTIISSKHETNINSNEKINLLSKKETKIISQDKINISSKKDLDIQSQTNQTISSNKKLSLLSKEQLKLNSKDKIQINQCNDIDLTSNKSINLEQKNEIRLLNKDNDQTELTDDFIVIRKKDLISILNNLINKINLTFVKKDDQSLIQINDIIDDNLFKQIQKIDDKTI